jgi:transposase
VVHLQEGLEPRNLKLHNVISSVAGVSGLKVIRAILAGQRDPLTLLRLCAAQIQKKKADAVQKALRGTWKEDHLFALEPALEWWECYQIKIAACDQKLERVLRERLHLRMWSCSFWPVTTPTIPPRCAA